MKIIVNILLFCISLSSMGQITPYKYTYVMRVHEVQKESKITIDTLNSNNSCITLKLTDLEGNGLSLVSAFVEHDSSIEEVQGNSNGIIRIRNIEKGIMRVTYIGFTDYEKEFMCIPGKEIKFEIRLAEKADPLPTIYEIRSKKRLKRKERKALLKCLEKKEENCGTEHYSISIQI